MHFSKMKSLLLFACMGVFSAGAHGQAVYGSLYGTVTDNGGAAIPNATVTVTDSAKGTSTEVQTNGSGEYRAEHLIPDKYDIKVTSAGFSNSETKGIDVFADSSLKVDAQLQVGGSTQTVEVNADSVPLLKTDRADVSATFESKTMEDLPIGNRNFTNLQLLLPGAQQLGWSHAADENPQGSKQIQVDGQAFGGVAFELDGTDNQDPILGIIVINPPLDALSETKITTQNFDAEFGKAVSSVVTAQTKSGSNKFHGSVFDYRQSNATQARDPFTQSPSASHPGKDGLIPGGLYNQFGGSIGGPIIKGKIFFFGDYQGLRQKVGTSALMTVPTPYLISTCLGQTTSPSGIAGCDFSEYEAALAPGKPIIYQPDGTPYANSVIPAAQLSPQAMALFTLLQPYKPTKAGGLGTIGPNNYAGSGTGLFNNNQWDARGDYQISQRIHAFGRFSRFTSTLTGKTLFGAAGGAGFGINGYGGNSTGADDSLATGADIAVTNTLVTDFRLGYYRYNVIGAKYDQNVNFATQLGIPGLNTGSGGTGGAPGFNVADVDRFGNTPMNTQSQGSQYGGGLNITRCNCPLIEKEDQFQAVNNWTKIFGNHALKLGADLRYARNLRVPSDTDRTGLLDFGSGPTSLNGAGGLGLATLVVGDVTHFGRFVSTSTNAKEFQKRDFFYVQDTWRASSKLTLNYGLRYEFYFPERVNGKQQGALMDLKTGYLHVAGVGGVPLNMGWKKASFPLNPRIGIAYQLNPKTVIRTGYGRSFDIGVFGSLFGHVVTQNLPVLANQSISPTGGQTAYAFCLGPGSNGCTQPAGQPAGGGPAAPTPVNVPSNGLLPAPGYAVSPKARPNDLRLPTVDAWNLSIQRSITPTLSVTMAYVANKGTHTLSAGDGNNTNPNEAAIFLPAQYSVTGQALHYDQSVKPTDTSGVPAGLGIAGISANGGTANNTYLRRYYGGKLAACADPNYAAQAGVPAGSCGWSNDISYYGNDQDSHFNALQVTVAKQFSRGLSFTSNYAWQRGIDFANGYATWLRQAGKGRNNDIREQQLQLYGLYQLPFGRNQMFASHANGFVNEVIGGWQISPVLNWASGLPFTLNLSSCSAYTPGSAPCYPNGNGKNLKTSLGSFNPVAHNRLYYNQGVVSGQLPTGFTTPTLDTIGTAGRNNAFGPHFFNTDISLMKDFPIRESILLQMRADAANAFNHINPANPGGNIDQGPQTIGSQAPGAAARQLQFSARIQF